MHVTPISYTYPTPSFTPVYYMVYTCWLQVDGGGASRKRKRAPLLTIFQKVQIVDFAVALVAEKKQAAQMLLLGRRSRKKKHTPGNQGSRQERAYRVRGLNLQKVCEKRFPELNGVKVCQLIAQCEKQSWRSLSVHQQKRYFHIPDSLKAALGQKTLRGWKNLGYDGLQQLAEEKGTVNRWAVPGPVLQDRVAGYFGGAHAEYFGDL